MTPSQARYVVTVNNAVYLTPLSHCGVKHRHLWPLTYWPEFGDVT